MTNALDESKAQAERAQAELQGMRGEAEVRAPSTYNHLS